MIRGIADIDHSPIPLFRLYGEEATSADAEFVHLEDIRARSSLYDWEITAHSHRGLFQVLLVLEGEALARLDDRRAQLHGPCAVVLPPAVVHAFQFTPDTHGYVLTVAETLLMEGGPQLSGPLVEDLFVDAQVVDMRRSPEEARRIAALVEQLAAELRWPQPGRTLMFDWLVRAVLLLIHRQVSLASGPKGKDRLRAQTFTRFRALVEEHYRDHWPVTRYAAALGATESRLNRICRDLAGKSAFEVVRDRLLLEARRRLFYIPAPVSMLAYELGFQDPAYFCRFFKKQTGMSPGEYRARAQVPE